MPWCSACPGGSRQDEFVAIALAPSQPPAGDIRLDLRRGAIAVNVTWPLSASSECAAWLREILR